jgi:hypothetical protein
MRLTFHTYHKPEQNHPTAMFRFNSGQRRELVQELANSSLVFDFNTSEIPSGTIPVWQQLDVQVKDHLTRNMIQLTSTDRERYVDAYIGLSWTLCKKNGQAEMPEYYQCTLDHIRQLAQPHPLHEQRKIFFIGKP